MNTLKNLALVIFGVLLISSFVSNETAHQPATKTELSNGEKNIELIKKLMKEHEFKKIEIFSTNFYFIEVNEDQLSFEDIYIVAKRDNENVIHINSDKIGCIHVDGKNLKFWVH